MLCAHVSASLGVHRFPQVHLPIRVVDQSGDVFHRLGSWRNYLPEWLHSLGVHVVHQVVKGPTGVRQNICQDSYNASVPMVMVKPGDTDMNQVINAPLGVVLDQVLQAPDENFPLSMMTIDLG